MTSNDCIHVEDGYYSLELTADDTGTPGYLRITFQIEGALIFHEDFTVLPQDIYHSDVLASDKRQVNVVEVNGEPQTEGDLAAIGTNIQSRLPAALTADGNIKSDALHLNGSATAASELAEAFDNDGTGGDMDLTSLNISEGATISNASGTALSLVGTMHGLIANGTGGYGINVVGTDDGIHAESTGVGDGIHGIGVGSGHGMHLDGCASGDDIKFAGQDASDIEKEVLDAHTVLSGTADNGTTTALVDAALNQANNDHWNDATIEFVGGNLAGVQAVVLDFDAGTDTITFAKILPAAVANGQEYRILRGGSAEANVRAWLGTVAAPTNVGGVPKVDVTHVMGDPVCD